jgi:hypothetical protein
LPTDINKLSAPPGAGALEEDDDEIRRRHRIQEQEWKKSWKPGKCMSNRKRKRMKTKIARQQKNKMTWYKENYPTGKLYIYNRRQGKFSGFHGNDIPFANGRPYLFVRWSTPVKSPSAGDKDGF